MKVGNVTRDVSTSCGDDPDRAIDKKFIYTIYEELKTSRNKTILPDIIRVMMQSEAIDKYLTDVLLYHHATILLLLYHATHKTSLPPTTARCHQQNHLDPRGHIGHDLHDGMFRGE